MGRRGGLNSKAPRMLQKLSESTEIYPLEDVPQGLSWDRAGNM